MNKSYSQKDKNTRAVLYAILAASLYGISSPVSKLLLVELSPTFMAALLYLGAGLGMLMVSIISGRGKRGRTRTEAKLTRKELPYVILMVLLDIAAPILLMFGLLGTTSANASLLNNFEIVATSLIALFIFNEAIGKRMWIAIGLITFSSMLLTLDDPMALKFSYGSFLVLLACLCWGLENNTTRKLSIKDPMQVVIIKGFGSGLGSLIITLALGEFLWKTSYVLFALILGFAAYGVSIYFYILAQRDLGAARTSAYYAAAPFIGVFISFVVFGTRLTPIFLIALLIMLAGTYFTVMEKHRHLHFHEEITHEHKHRHDDQHHDHVHEREFTGEHSHLHEHGQHEHAHEHSPDIHHRHKH